jgi:hypothetical protein
MRTLIINMLAAALLLFGASSAGAFSITHSTNYDGFSELEVSDTVQVNVFIDTEGADAYSQGVQPGLANLSVGIVFTAPNLVYSGSPSAPNTYAYLNYYVGYVTGSGTEVPNPAQYAGDNGSQSTYMLFTFKVAPSGTFPGQGYYAQMVPARAPWITWAAPPPGQGQVNLDWIPPYAVPNFNQQTRGSTNTWLGSIVLHVAALGSPTVEAGVFVDGTCCSVRTGDGTEHRSTTTTDALTQINLPEPTIALLLGFGLLGLGLAGRRQD